MGEARKKQIKMDYYLGLDYREVDSFTIEDAEIFISEVSKRDVFIIPEENKICMEDTVCEGKFICRYYLTRDTELWLADLEDDRDYDIKPYGTMWLRYMYENLEIDYTIYQLNGQTMPMAEDVNKKATKEVFLIKNDLLKKKPYEKKWNIIQREQHLIELEEIAKEIVIKEIVFNKELYKREVKEISEDDLPF